MKRNLQRKSGLVLIATCFIMMFSCKKTFDLQPLSEVSITNNYRTVVDANAAVFGVYAQFLQIAEQYEVLNELRGDLMDITPNADKYLQAISHHTVKASDANPWANPRPFYKVILSCNDVLYNLNIMLAQNKISVADYNYRYSDIGALRSFLYLQLGIHWGSVPYVTDPLSNIDDLKDPSKFQRVDFPTLLNNLIAFTANLPWLEPYPSVIALINGSTTTTPPTPATIDGFNFTHYFINKRCVLADLYLWRAGYGTQLTDYQAAATQYRAVVEATLVPTGNPLADLIVQYSGDLVNFNDFSVDYNRYRAEDINSLVSSNTQGWRSMFARPMYPTYDTRLDAIWIWQMNFPNNTTPVDPFVDLFSSQGGRYLVQPSQQAIDVWNQQIQNGNGANFATTFWSDARMRLTFADPTGNYSSFNNQNEIMKNLYIYQDATVAQSNKYGRWFLYRDATLQLRFAECANRDPINPSNTPGGYGRLAYALMNNGVNAAFNVYNYSLTPAPVTDCTTGITYNYPATTALATVPNGDVTNTEQTFFCAPYNIDARNGATPNYRNGWYQGEGIRGRANLTAYPIPASFTNPATVQTQEDQLLSEAGMELAYEGVRWADLLRISIRRNTLNGGNSGFTTVLANLVGAKLTKDGYSGAAAAQAKLAGGDVYLPFNW